MKTWAWLLLLLVLPGCATLGEVGTDFGDVIFDRDARERVQVRYDAFRDSGEALVEQIKAEIDSPAVGEAIGRLILGALGRLSEPLQQLLEEIAAAPPGERQRYVAQLQLHVQRALEEPG